MNSHIRNESSTNPMLFLVRPGSPSSLLHGEVYPQLGGILEHVVVEVAVGHFMDWSSMKAILRKSLAATAVLIGFVSVAFSSGKSREEKVLKGYPLTVSGYGIRSADFSPDGRFLSLGLVQLHKSGRETTFSDAVAVWDLKSRELVANTTFDSGAWVPFCEPRFLQYMPDGHQVVVLARGIVTVFDPTSPREQFRRIDLNLPPQRPDVPTPWVVDMKVAPVGHKIGVLITYLPHNSASLRLYDADTKRVVWEWKFQEDVNGYSVAFSPDGSKLAVAMPLARKGTGLLVIDINSRQELFRLTSREGTLPAAAAFASNNELATVPTWKHGRMNVGSIEFWNIDTRKMVRQVSASPGGVHAFVDISTDCRKILAYIGREKTVGHFPESVDERFRIWELPSGKVIATSPDLPRPHQSMLPETRLSPNGEKVIAYWPESFAPAEIFELVPTLAARPDPN